MRTPLLWAATFLSGCICGPAASSTDIRTAQLEQTADGKGQIRLSTSLGCDASADAFLVKLGEPLAAGRWGSVEKRGTLTWCEAGRCGAVSGLKSWSVTVSGSAPAEQVAYSIDQSATLEQRMVASSLGATRCP